jgi:hypothetical protein
MPLGIPRVRLIFFGALALLVIAGIGLVTVDAKQIICRPDIYSSNWFFNFLRRDLCNFSPPVSAPFLYFNYGEAHMASGDADTFVSSLNPATPLSMQIAWTDSRFSPCCCTYSADASSGIMLRRNGEPSPPAPPNAGNITFSASGQLPNASCSTDLIPVTLDQLQTMVGLVLNQQINGNAQMTFQQSGAPARIMVATQGGIAGGIFQLTLTRFDSVPGGTVGANFELLLRDDNDPNSDPNSRKIMLITHGTILVTM